MDKKFWVFSAIYLPVLFWIIILGYLYISKSYQPVVFIFLGGVSLRVFIELIYFFIKRPRPYQVLNLKPASSWLMMSGVHNHPDSFPSAHAAVMFFGSFFLIFNNFYLLGILAFIAALLTSIGRIKLHYHYLIDILAGAFLALIWLIFVGFIARM